MVTVKYIGVPDDLTDDEIVAQNIINNKIKSFLKSFPTDSGRLRSIAGIDISFNVDADTSLTSTRSNSKDTLQAPAVEELSTVEKSAEKDKGIAYFSSSNPMYSLDQVILPETTIKQIEEALQLLEYQNLIFEEWGFKKIEPNYKVALNFFGPPGTGKTMTAHAIAHKLGKKIVAVDYAQIESKFVGDAPKNLNAAFKQANDDDAILFFDEADSFLGKRIAGISTGSEQAINSLRSQMLLAIDNFSGIVIFSSNFIENYDKAFETRIRHVNFALPDKQSIEKIISTLLPHNAPIEENIIYSELAEECIGFSGRDIKHSVLLAATKAAGGTEIGERVITHQFLVDSIRTVKVSLETFGANVSGASKQHNLSHIIKNKLTGEST